MKKILTKIITLTKIDSKKDLIDYKSYFFSMTEIMRFVLEGCLVWGMVSFLCYDSFVMFFILLFPFLYFYLDKKQQTLCEKRKQTLNSQFREVILAVSSHLQAGFSLENAFHEAYRDIKMLYGNDSLMARELVWVLRRVDNNESLELALSELAERSGLEDISEFVGILTIAKRSGGDIRSIILRTATIIGDKMEVKREIETMMSEKKLEQRIMQCMPFLLIGYLAFTSPGFLDSLYHNLFGVVLMTGCLGVYVFACYLSEKILQTDI